MELACAGRKARYIYGGAALHPTENLPVQSVARYDLETGHMQLWSKGSHYFMGEPQFIPRRESEDPGLHPFAEQRHAELHPQGFDSHADRSASQTHVSNGHSVTSSSSTDGNNRAARQTDTLSDTTNGDSSKAPAIPISPSCPSDGNRVPSGIKEDDGWILSVGFDANLQRSELVLLDAANIEAGPIAVLPLASPVGYGIHGTWVPDYFGPDLQQD